MTADHHNFTSNNFNFAAMKYWMYCLAITVMMWSCGGEPEQPVVTDITKCFQLKLDEVGFDWDDMIEAFDAYYVENKFINDTKASSYLGVLEFLEYNDRRNPSFETVYKAPEGAFLFEEIDVCIQKNQELHADAIAKDPHLQRVCAVFELLRGGDIIMSDLLDKLREVLVDAPDDDKFSKAFTILFTTMADA
jgi:hypothetical protein